MNIFLLWMNKLFFVKEEKMAKSVKKTTTKTTAKTKKTTTSAKKTPASEVKKTPAATRAKRIAARDLSNVNPEFTDAFIQEVDEDVKNDNLKVIWNRYGVFIIAFVVLAVSAAISFDRIRAWKTAQNQKETETYMAASQLQENPQDTIMALQKITQDNQGIFGDFARLQIANVLFNEGKNDEALAALQGLIDDKQVNSEVKHIALIKYATYQVDVMPQEEFRNLLQPLLSEDNSWTPLANDLLAMSAIHNGDIEAAKKIYEGILKIKDLPESFRVKIQDMLSSLNDM